MNTQERQNYLWRPNDESVTTRTRYDLEVDHFYRSFKSAERKHNISSFRSDFGVIGLFVSLVFSLLTLVVILIIDFIKLIRLKN